MRNILHSQEDSKAILSHVARNVRDLRATLGLTQQEVAERAGLSRRMVVSLEAGDANISLAKLSHIATALGVSFSQIISEEKVSRTVQTYSQNPIVVWSGTSPQSHAVFFGAAQVAKEVEFWLWSMASGERYQGEADPQGYKEMIYVIEGLLHIASDDETLILEAGSFTLFDSARAYTYINAGKDLLRFARNVVN